MTNRQILIQELETTSHSRIAAWIQYLLEHWPEAKGEFVIVVVERGGGFYADVFARENERLGFQFPLAEVPAIREALRERGALRLFYEKTERDVLELLAEAKRVLLEEDR